MRFPLVRHRLWQVAVDAGLVAAAWVLSWYVRFEGDSRPRYYDRNRGSGYLAARTSLILRRMNAATLPPAHK